MGLSCENVGLLEQELIHIPTPNTYPSRPRTNILQRMAESAHVQLLGTILAIGGGFLMTHAAISPEKIVMAKEAPPIGIYKNSRGRLETSS